MQVKIGYMKGPGCTFNQLMGKQGEECSSALICGLLFFKGQKQTGFYYRKYQHCTILGIYVFTYNGSLVFSRLESLVGLFAFLKRVRCNRNGPGGGIPTYLPTYCTTH